MTSELDKRLEAAVQSNDRYRSRARAVATLSAAAAGALAAGLIFTPRNTLPEAAQTFGLVSIILLIVSTGLNIAASASSSYGGDLNWREKIIHPLEVWRIRVDVPTNDSPAAEHEKRIAEARTVKRGISRTMSWGLWFATVSAAFLIVSLAIATFSGNAIRHVSIELEDPLNSNSCPGVKKVISGEVRDRDRTSESSLLPISVSPDDCKNDSGATLYLDKSAVVITSEGS